MITEQEALEEETTDQGTEAMAKEEVLVEATEKEDLVEDIGEEMIEAKEAIGKADIEGKVEKDQKDILETAQEGILAVKEDINSKYYNLTNEAPQRHVWYVRSGRNTT